MKQGERDLWLAVFAASYVGRSENELLGSQTAREHAVNHAACVASDALAGLRRALDNVDLPVDVATQASAATMRRR